MSLQFYEEISFVSRFIFNFVLRLLKRLRKRYKIRRRLIKIVKALREMNRNHFFITSARNKIDYKCLSYTAEDDLIVSIYDII